MALGRNGTVRSLDEARNLSIGGCRVSGCLDGCSVDPGFGRGLGRVGPGGESFGVGGLGGVEGGLAVLEDHGVVAGVEVGGT